jgi:hypothetical protein
MRVNDASEREARSLSMCCFGKEVIVLCKQDTAQTCCPIEQLRVVDFVSLVFVGCDDIYLP